MKVIGISFVLLLALMGVAAALDFFGGSPDLNASIRNIFNPFLVMETIEMVIFIFIVLCVFIPPVRQFFQKRNKSKQ
ncbi:hypothetical protein [Domibacillus indicus]|uniref:hypothetical protein n=1 Tax=Domibacillus indicus TaxID=1437523 RepID=UPI0006180D7C|nr:hypothetical protein [Domibacillus indicus]